jgi:hypothetical protein
VQDVEWLRVDITTAQGRLRQPGEEAAVKEGNNRRRLQLRVEVPGYGPRDAGRLAGDLAAGRARAVPAAGEVLAVRSAGRLTLGIPGGSTPAAAGRILTDLLGRCAVGSRRTQSELTVLSTAMGSR